MVARTYLGADVFSLAYDRFYKAYSEGHRVVVSVSGGKDSTVIMEVAIMAARDAGRLPVEICTRDEEIMLPGTFEYLERVAERTDEVQMRWFVANMPIVNAFSRSQPMWWTFDPTMNPEQWVRQPPPYFERVPELHIRWTANSHRYPVDHEGGQRLYSVTGIRTQESPNRNLAIASSGKAMGAENAYMTGYDPSTGYYGFRPIYDWTDGDVWKFIRDFKLDYNHAYDVMLRMGVPKRNLRIAPPTMRVASMRTTRLIAGAWPKWFDKVCERVPGIRTAVKFGDRMLFPERQLGESNKELWERCVTGPGNPDWIRERGRALLASCLASHSKHATGDLPDAVSCPMCQPKMGCYASLARYMYMGDVFGYYAKSLGPVDPEYFRPGAGRWIETDAEIRAKLASHGDWAQPRPMPTLAAK